MAITVVCVTNVGSELHRRVILEKPSTAYNLIDVADRFLDLQRDHALVHGAEFNELQCYLDEVHIQTRYLIEYASTFFYTVRQKYFNEHGCTIYKHDTDVKCFMKMVSSGAQPTCMAPPVWRDPRLLVEKPTARVRKVPPGPAALAAPLEAERVQAQEPAPSLVVNATPDEPETPEQRRRFKPSNLGTLGKL